MEEQKLEVYEEDKLTQLQETFLGMLADAPTPARQQSAKKLKVEHPGRRTARPSSTTAPHDDSHQTTQVSQLCRMLAVLALRHEDALNSLACQDQFILFLAHGPQGMPPLMIQTAQDWREQSSNTMPLRVALMKNLLEELMRRFKGFCAKLSDEDFRRQSIQTKVILEDNTIPFLQWCHQQEVPVAFSDGRGGIAGHGAAIATPALSSTGTKQLDPVLCPPQSGPNYRSDTMEDSAFDEERRPHVRNEASSELSSVDAHCRSVESPFPTTLKSSSRDPGGCLPSQVREPPTLGDILRGALLGAQLCNNSCCINLEF